MNLNVRWVSEVSTLAVALDSCSTVTTHSGAVWSDGCNSLILSVPKLAHPVSTIGAGDSTLAGILHVTARGLDRETVLRTAVSFGTAACMTEGTLPPKAEDVKAVFGQTRVL